MCFLHTGPCFFPLVCSSKHFITCPQRHCRYVFAAFLHTTLKLATESHHFTKDFSGSGGPDQNEAKLHVLFQFVSLPVAAVEPHAPAKPNDAPKPACKAVPKHVSMSCLVVMKSWTACNVCLTAYAYAVCIPPVIYAFSV
mmetsp:Transcript_121346/g.210924  ORF Transcript_121346/g.210924 Transcript_121346/m.210924 type:complete len:140 (-) Transcript_121346:403-822(-)